MNALLSFTCLSLSLLAQAYAEDGPEIIRPIGRVPAEPAMPETEAIPKDYADDKAIAMKVEALTRTENGYYQVKLRIINPTDKAMTFTGFSEKSPITKTEHWEDGKWVEEKRFLRCGTGLRPCTIAPGQSVVFQATLEGEKLPTRIGVSYAHGDDKQQLTVWSEKIER